MTTANAFTGREHESRTRPRHPCREHAGAVTVALLAAASAIAGCDRPSFPPTPPCLDLQLDAVAVGAAGQIYLAGRFSGSPSVSGHARLPASPVDAAYLCE